MRRHIIPLVGLLLSIFSSGCSVYESGFRFAPHPGIVEIPSTQSAQGPAVSTSVSVIGVRKDDSTDHLPASVEVRLRFDNNGLQPVTFNPHTLQLLNGELLKFPPPILDSHDSINLNSQESAVVSAYFPFPPGKGADDTDLDSLQLRWNVTVEGRTVGESVNFRRSVPVYYEPYWGGYPYVGFGSGYYGGGVVAVHHHRW